ncbi:mechanosensitive ion channel [uncultured Cocleimonas sp.]|uniref:mechanosensitive ion channel n=1 Tax=uncultured Cocleimonas sp. TaxID=1051587 RepID=UPI002625D0E4|nr:mechanosensitive ion channel [uncultured Cocleimonas sp.]
MIATSLFITSSATSKIVRKVNGIVSNWLEVFQRLFLAFCVFCLLLSGAPVFAESHTKTDENITEKVEVPSVEATKEEIKLGLTQQTLSTMLDFLELQERLKNDLVLLQKELKTAKSETETAELKAEIKTIEDKLKDTKGNIENIAADTDLGALESVEAKPFDLQKEIMALLEPALKEMKYATNDVRKKSDLREKIDYFSKREPIVKEALANIAELNKANKNPKIAKALEEMNDNWSKQLVFIQSELKAKQLQLEKLVAEETTFLNKSESFFKNFFQRRGWVLIQALLSIIGILILSRLIHSVLTKTVKGYRAQYRSVQLRVIDLMHRIGTLLFLIIGPMVVFYLAEDWVLFSLGVLFLIAFAWKLGQAIPRYWSQLELFLNVGPVREGERLLLYEIPWRVKNINMYSVLENPVADLTLRLDINDLVDLRSRQIVPGEPWFPCKQGDWVILKDGLRGKVIGISLELVQLIQRGGAVSTYQMDTFLSLSPLNMSKSFRVKETFGVSYKHQKESTTDIVQKLKFIINKRAVDEGYEDHIQSINVEFESAAESSLNLVVIADFKGEVADISNRLRRSIQRWCVDAATENGWEIPFPQLTVHREDN